MTMILSLLLMCIPVEEKSIVVEFSEELPVKISVLFLFRHCTTRSTPQPVMCGALEQLCMRYGVWDMSHLRATTILRFGQSILCTWKNLIADGN